MPQLPIEIRWRKRNRPSYIADMLQKHFDKLQVTDLTIAQREFPFRVRADLQRALEAVLGDPANGMTIHRFVGVHARMSSFEGLHLSALFQNEHNTGAVAAPPAYEEVDIGEAAPVRCLRNGLWLMEKGATRLAFLINPAMSCGQKTGLQFQIAAANSAEAPKIVEEFFRAMEISVNESRSYRGKILSLETDRDFSGKYTGIKVHRLRTVQREEVILPAKTIALLDRNVIQFSTQREMLRKLGQATKKGLLFYGPPGTGKSHTIHYLASALKGHTTLLISAEQVIYLSEYMALARLLQPSIVVIEDVDLIARDRTQMHNPTEEAILNKLLNEMDGLKESADILFILTTNRPEALEQALASRPGRVDQAIEFPLPDAHGREMLVRLYSRGIALSDELIQTTVNRTENVSAAFIKELMRRSAQFHLERNGDSTGLTVEDVSNALEEMLFSGGSLNLKLLGGNIGPAEVPSA